MNGIIRKRKDQKQEEWKRKGQKRKEGLNEDIYRKGTGEIGMSHEILDLRTVSHVTHTV